MNAPTWVLRETVLALHKQLIAEFGGETGLRDEGLLDSALARPLHQFAYLGASAATLAAGFAFGLVKNHPFFDGNKRIGFSVALVFVEINGHHFSALPRQMPLSKHWASRQVTFPRRITRPGWRPTCHRPEHLCVIGRVSCEAPHITRHA